MELNRNQFFAAGFFLLLIGIQLRVVESYVLTPQVTERLAKIRDADQGEIQSGFSAFLRAAGPPPRKVVRLPDWSGFAFLSVGAVLLLHALAMPKPGGG